MAVNYIRLGQRLKAIRKNRNLSQKQCADLLDSSASYISYIENGRKSMSLDFFVSVANTLAVSADDLLCDSLTVKSKAFDQEIVSIFSDCTESERFLLIESLKNLKKSLRTYDNTKSDESMPNKRYGI